MAQVQKPDYWGTLGGILGTVHIFGTVRYRCVFKRKRKYSETEELKFAAVGYLLLIFSNRLAQLSNDAR